MVIFGPVLVERAKLALETLGLIALRLNLPLFILQCRSRPFWIPGAYTINKEDIHPSLV